MQGQTVSVCAGPAKAQDAQAEAIRRADSEPSGALSASGELMDLRAWTSHQEDSDRVFANPTGHVYPIHSHAKHFRAALAKAGITDRVRTFHDGRHAALTGAATVTSGASVQALAGHSSFSTTQRYLHLAGTMYRDDAELGAARLRQEVSAD